MESAKWNSSDFIRLIDIKKPLKPWNIIIMIFAISVVTSVASSILKYTIYANTGYSKIHPITLFAPVLEVASSLFFAGALHIFGLIYGELREGNYKSFLKESFASTYTSYFYALLPFLLVSWIIEPLFFFDDLYGLLFLPLFAMTIGLFFNSFQSMQKLGDLSTIFFSFIIFVIFLSYPLSIYASAQPIDFLASGVVFQESGNQVYVVTNKHAVDIFSEGSCVGFTRLSIPFLPPSVSAQPVGDFTDVTNQVINSVLVLNGSYVPRQDVTKINLTTFNQTVHEGHVFWKAPGLIDLAVVTFTENSTTKDYVVANATSIDLKRAEDVIAIGAPFTYEYSVTRGIISSIRDVPTSGKDVQWIQTDTEINPGNSGGGLFDKNGNLIGINTCYIYFPDFLGSNSLRFAISINTFLQIFKP